MAYITHFTDINLVATVITGDTAGSHTVSGIESEDKLKAVLNTTDAADLTSEFSISGADTIDNSGGTDTTGDTLVVVYVDQNL